MTITLNGTAWNFSPCPHCAGSGTKTRTREYYTKIKTINFECQDCQGRGYLRTLKEIAHPTRNSHYQKAK